MAALSPAQEVALAIGIAAAFLFGPAILIVILMRRERGVWLGAAGWVVLAAVGLYLQWRQFVDH